MATMTVSGVVSGMDWEGMITQMIESAQKPAKVQMNKRVNLTNKKTLFEEMKTLTQTLQGSLTSLRLSSTYRAKNVEVERLDSTASPKGVLTAKVNADAPAGVYNVEVKQLATAYTRRSNQLTDNSLLDGYAGSTLNFTQAGQKFSVTVDSGETLSSLAAKINNTVKTADSPMNFTASVVDSRLIFKSDDMGRGSAKYTDSVTYDGSGLLTLDDLSIDTDNLAAEDFVITGKSGKEYKLGEDFDIVNGNQVRWRTSDAKTVGAGDSFTMKYKAALGDKYTSGSITRGSGAVDSKALNFEPSQYTDASRLSITDEDGFAYTYGTDFDVSGTSIRWLAGGNAPDEDTTYTVDYTATGGEEFELEATRGDSDTLSEDYSNIPAGTLTITTSDGTTLYGGVDFELTEGENKKAAVVWNAASTWAMPDPGDVYTLTVTQSDGTTKDYAATRGSSDSVDLKDLGFTQQANGTISSVTYGDETIEASDFADIALTGASVAGNAVSLTWGTFTTTPRTDLPASGDKLTVEYRYNSNEFQIDDGGSGLLSSLGLDLTDEEHLTAAQDAIVAFDGEEWNLVSNELDYENDILNGVKLEFKGVGEVSLDITHNTEKAVESAQTFVESYNALMDWINTRSSEKQVNTDYSDDSTSLSRSSDEFHTSWGLLYGNSYLRTTKTALRSVLAQNFSYTFTERASAKAVYGTMEFNGLKSASTLRVGIGDRYANISITPEDTLDTIAAKINDFTDSDANPARALHYNEKGERMSYIRAEVVDNKLVVKTGSSAGTGEEVSLAGTAALNALNMNTSYKGLYQIGIETTSDDYGKSGQLDFDSGEFTAALEDNPEEVEKLMMAFAKQMDAQMKSMLTSSGDMSGTLTRQITNIETQITDIDEYLAKFQQRLDDKEEALRKQYAAAEDRIAKLSQQASSISGILAQLSNGSNAASA